MKDSLEQPMLLDVLALGGYWAVQATDYERPQWWGFALLVAGAAIALLVVRNASVARWATLAHAVAVGVADRITREPTTRSDVMATTREAIEVLAEGGNPYTHTYLAAASPDSPFPYLPGEIAFYGTVQAIFGEIWSTDKWAAVGVIVLLAALAPLVGAARAALATSLYATFGVAAVVSADGSNDTSLAFLVVLGVFLLVWSEHVRPPRAGLLFYSSAVVFALALLFKQFVWLLYPFIVLYLRRAGLDWRRHAAISYGIAVVVVLPFFFAAPVEFVENTLGGLAFHEDVWGLNLWNATESYLPGLVESVRPAIPAVDVVVVVVVGSLLLLRPASSLVSALLQGLVLLLVVLLLGRWTTFSYYAFAGALGAVAVALVGARPVVRQSTGGAAGELGEARLGRKPSATDR